MYILTFQKYITWWLYVAFFSSHSFFIELAFNSKSGKWTVLLDHPGILRNNLWPGAKNIPSTLKVVFSWVTGHPVIDLSIFSVVDGIYGLIHVGGPVKKPPSIETKHFETGKADNCVDWSTWVSENMSPCQRLMEKWPSCLLGNKKGHGWVPWNYRWNWIQRC